MMGFVINLDTWNKLTPETQATIEACYIEGIKYQLDSDIPQIESAKKYVEDRGDEIIHLTDAEREVWVPYMDPVVNDWAEESQADGYDTVRVICHLMELLHLSS
jgi:TRAP-type C4-dicarboxylate transport system substrate-binding protein